MRMMHRPIFLTAALVLLVATAATAQQPQNLRLGVNNWPFWRIHNEGVFSGADVDIWREIAKRNNLHIQCTFLPDFRDMQKRLAQKDGIDALIGLLRNAEREQYLYYIEPPYRTKLLYLTYVRADSDLSIERLADMRGRTVVLASPVSYAAFDDDPEINKELTPSWNVRVAADKLIEGRVDVLHMCDWQAIWFFKNNPEYRDRLRQTRYTHREYHPNYLVMSKQSPLAEKMKGQIGRTLRNMLDDGTVRRIVDSYVPGWWEYYEK